MLFPTDFRITGHIRVCSPFRWYGARVRKAGSSIGDPDADDQAIEEHPLAWLEFMWLHEMEQELRAIGEKGDQGNDTSER